MNKKFLLATVSAILLITGCNNAGVHGNRGDLFGSLFASSNSEITQSSSIDQSSEIGNTIGISGAPIYNKIDIDLTKMNSNMVYSQVFNMLSSPNSYMNKIVKVSGPFVPLQGDDINYVYPAVVIRDATACCANGLEFLLYGVPRCSYRGGDGYPLRNEEVTIVGRFTTYIENMELYIHLVDAIWLKDY